MRFLTVALVAVLLISCAEQPQPPAQPEEKPVVAPAKILHFYASPPEVARGAQVTVCYGVENVSSVRIEPEVEQQLKPYFNRCFQVTPVRNTTYRLVAEGRDGQTISESIAVKVRARSAAYIPVPMIGFFGTSAPEIVQGQSATLCYRVEDATALTLEPNVQAVEPSDRFCFSVSPSKTTTYTLTATGAGGRKEKKQLTVTVR
jgi:hypothetical protein